MASASTNCSTGCSSPNRSRRKRARRGWKRIRKHSSGSAGDARRVRGEWQARLRIARPAARHQIARGASARGGGGKGSANTAAAPPEMRGGFAVNGKRVYELLDRLLVTKSLAAQARAAGLEKDPQTQQRLSL